MNYKVGGIGMIKLLKGLFICLLSVTALSSCETNIRYTVTKQEWDAAVIQSNYTIDYYENDELLFSSKYTENVLELEGSYILFEGDKQYAIDYSEEYGWVASDVTGMEFEKGALLSGCEYEAFKYDKESKSYVYTEEDVVYDIKFENGSPVSFTCTFLDTSTTPATNNVIHKVYSNVGTTTITLPEYIYASDIEKTIDRTVDEDTWNSFKGLQNYSLSYIILAVGIFEVYSVQITEYAILFEDDIYVFEDEKTYLLKENKSSWVATEVENFNPFKSEQVLLDGLNYTDFTYDEETKSYIYSKDNDTVIYTVTFKNDVLVYYSI